MLLTLNGIEKVRGSTPLISTSSICVQINVFRKFPLAAGNAAKGA